MVRRIIEEFVKYKILANIVIAVTIISGGLALVNMNHSFFPEQEQRNVVIDVVYPGASPEEMEEGVTLKIEEGIRNLEGIDKIYSTSSENSSRITVVTLKGYDIDEIYTEIKNSVDRISSFPVSAERPIIFKQNPFSFAMFLSIWGDVDLKVLKNLAEDVKDDLLASGLMSQINVRGKPELEISIEVSEENLRRYELTFDQVAQAVRNNNRDISAGSIKASSEEILIRSRAKKDQAERIGDILIRANQDGSRLLLRDVATVREQFQDVPNKLIVNNKRALSIGIEKLPEEDLSAISKYVNKYVEEYNQKNEAVTLEVTYDFNIMLWQRINMLLKNGGIGLLLVLISLGVFLSIRLSLWVAWGIPSSFLGMFLIGTVVGITINMLSLFGMILVVGILVDDGIVIAENIYSHFEKGKSPPQAAVDGTLEVLPAVFTSVTTTIIAFTPVLLISGPLEFLYELAVVVVASLAFSLLEAFFVLPAHLGTSDVLRAKNRTSKIRRFLNRGIAYQRDVVYGSILRFTMKYKVLSIAFLIAVFPIVGGLMSGGYIKTIFFPDISPPFINASLSFKAGTREHKTEEVLEDIDRKIWEVNEELKTKYNDPDGYLSYTFIQLGSNDSGESGSHIGQVQIFYKELDRDVSTKMLENNIRDKIGLIPDAEKFTVGGRHRFGKPVSIRLTGRNLLEVDEATVYLRSELKKLEQLRDITDDKTIGKRELTLELTPQAYFVGLDHSAIVKQIRQGFFGEEVQRLQKGIDEVKVWVRYPNTGRANLGQLETMKVKVGEKEYPVNEMVNYRIERGVSTIKHYSGARTVTVEADLSDPNADIRGIIAKIKQDVYPVLEAKWPSVKILQGGQSEESQKAFGEILLGFGLAFVGIFIAIMLAFRSFYQSILVMLMIPLGFIGAILGHGIQGIPVSFLSSWGMVALSGVIINDAVVFLDRYNRNLKEGQTVYDASYNAGIARFRPIVLTSITTVLGLFPLLIERSYQAQFLIPMATSVAYGVLIGTFIILLFFPVWIVIFNDVRRYAKWAWIGGEKPSRESVERVVIDREKEHLFELAKQEDNSDDQPIEESEEEMKL